MSIPCDKTFPLVPTFFTCDFGLLFENFNLVHNFLTVSARVFFFLYEYFLWEDLFPLSLKFDFKKNEISHNIILNIRAFI